MPFGQGAKLQELLDDRARLEREAGALKGRIGQVNQQITDLVKPALDAAFKRDSKSSGTVKFVLDNHIYKAVINKRVDWNSDALKDLEGEISEALARNLFKKVYSVPEAHFQAVLDPTLRAKLTVARTVRYDEPKISLAENEDA